MKGTITILFLLITIQISAQCWQSISAGDYHSLAIKNDGTLWAWGRNTSYELGDGTDVNRNIPTQIGTANDWVKVHAGYSSSYGIKADGTLWAWGANGSGKLGTGNGNWVIATPTQIGTATNWLSVSDGWYHTIALKTDGTLWVWGDNEYGQLGDNTTVDKLTPIQIGTTTNWQTIATGIYHSLAIKTDGTLWFWGSRSNIYGTSSQNNIPTQIGTDTNWLKLAGGQHHCAAIKTDGTLWTWGENSTGQLGDGTTTYRTNPIQVGTATDWLDVSVGTRYTIATKNNFSLWSWGYNYSGQLGNGTSGNNSNVFIPTQVGTSLDASKIAAGGYHVLVKNEDGFIRGTGSNVVGQIGDGTYVQKDTFTYISCYPSTLSNEDFAINKLKVYPNPVNDVLNFSFDKEITAVSIINLLGQEVFAKAVNSNESRIDISNVISGTYIVKVTFVNGGTKTLKIIKD
jgi:alpha-tubulin suppressor-like RCC1 family protein